MPNQLHETARALVAAGKGILAADESTATIKKRFDSIGIESTEENRRAYRDLLFTTEGAEEFISGVILFDETIRQSAARRHAVPGAARRPRASSPGSRSTRARSRWRSLPGETITEGLDGLRERLAEYRELGARFAKWRAVISIGDGHPERVLHLDQRPRARALRGALPGGRDRPDRRARGADGRRPHDRALRRVTDAHAAGRLHRAVRPARRPRGDAAQAEHGALRQRRSRAGGGDEVAEATVRCFRRHVPAAVPGHRLPLRRPDGRGRDGAPERDERARPAPVGAVVLVRPRAAGARR